MKTERVDNTTFAEAFRIASVYVVEEAEDLQTVTVELAKNQPEGRCESCNGLHSDCGGA